MTNATVQLALKALKKSGESLTVSKDEKKPKTYPIGGKGRKQCKSCGVFVGVRTKVCVCGEPFEKRSHRNPIVELGEDPGVKNALLFGQSLGLYSGNRILWTPSGDCPVRFKGDVETWARDLSGFMCSKYSYIMSPSALKYWLRTFFNDEDKRAKALTQLDEFVESMIGIEL